MQRFIPYYGAKWKLAERYGPPRFDHVVEPFAGSAGYSCYWEPKKVTLIDCDPVVCGVWRFLTRVSAKELMRLPSHISDVAELPPRVCQEAKSLIGFWFNHGLAEPAPRRSNWARNPIQSAFFWSETIKLRLASQVDRIRHWKIIEGSWEDAPNVKAHWHVDPPYQGASGNSYRFYSVHYRALAKWCKSRRGFVQVCENDGATWLPFEPFSIIHSHRAAGHSAEAVCEMEN
jgi:site-specific DNA-adenine methylase